MSSHVHLIIGTETGNLSDIIRDMKRHTSKSLLKTISENMQESRREWMMWMLNRQANTISTMRSTNFGNKIIIPIELSTIEMFNQRLDYLHYNPVESGAVAYPQDYLYSSAIDYYTDQKGLLPIFTLS